MDIARGHNLPTNDPGIISQMYGDTRVPQKAPSTSAQTALDLLLNAPMQTFAPPGVGGNQEMINQSRVINDRAIQDQVANNNNISGWDRIKTIAQTVAETPGNIKESMTTETGGLNPFQPAVPVAKDAFNTVNELYSMPIDYRKSVSGEVIYKTAVDPNYKGWNGETIELERIIAIDPATLGLPTYFNPSDAFKDPANRDIVKNIYETAEAAGEDGGRAVWEWYIGQYEGAFLPPAVTRLGTEVAGDPTNWPLLLTPAGELAAAKAAMQTGRTATVYRTVGQLLKAPEQIADAPFEVPAGLFKAARWGAKGLRGADEVIETTGREGGNVLTRSSEAQKARDEAEALIRQGVVAQELQANPQYVNRAEQLATEQSAARQALIQAEAINRVGGQGYAPRPDGQGRLIPGDQGPAPVGPLTNAVQQPGTPMPVNPAVGPNPLETQPLTPTPDLEIDNIMADVNRLQSPGTRVGPAPIVDQPSAVAPDEVIDTSVGVPKPVEDGPRSQPGSNFPERGPVLDKDTGNPVDFTLNPDPNKSRMTEQIAFEQPHIWTPVKAQVEPWVTNRYQPNRNLLTKDKLSKEAELERLDIPGAEPYIPKARVDAWSRLAGTNPALAQVLDAELAGRMRLAVRLEGGNVDNLTFNIPKNYADNSVLDTDLQANYPDIPTEKLRSGETKAAYAARYMYETDPTLEEAQLEWLVDNHFFRTEPPGTGSAAISPQHFEEQQRAYDRYLYAQSVKPLTGDVEKLDAFIAENGLTKAEVKVNPADVEKMPTPQTVRQRGDTWTADTIDTIQHMPAQAQAEITSELAKWSEDAYRNIDTASPRTQVFTDLELGARTRALAAERGIPLIAPESVYYDPDSLDEIIRAAVQEPDPAASQKIVDQLIEVGQARVEPPVSYLQSYDPALYAAQKQAYENFTQINTLRQMMHASPEELGASMRLRAERIARPPDPMLGPPAPNKIAIPQKQYDDRVAREIKKITKEWANDPSKGVPTQGDNLLAAALEDGALTEAEVLEFRTPLLLNYESKGDIKKYQTTAFDIFIEQMGMEKNVTFADAVRETGNIIRKSKNLLEPEVSKGRKAVNLGWKQYDNVTKIYRDMYLYNPVALARNTFVDSFANSITQMMTGHKLSGLKSLPFVSPRTHWAMYRHNIDSSDIQHAALAAAKNWDIKPGAGVVDVVTRELEDVGKTAWAPVPVVGGALKHGQALRHTTDQVNRANMWGDQFGRELKKALYGAEQTPAEYMAGITPDQGFYNRVIGVMGGGQKADQAVADLKKLESMGGFKPSDVKQITGSPELMKDWRVASRQAGKNADEEVGRIFFSYRQTNADAATRRVFMFHYWMSRALVQHTKLALSNPLLLYRYTAAWEALGREADRQGLDGPMAPLQMYFEFMKGDGGMFGISNPVAAFTPYSMFADMFTSYGSETTFDKTLGKFGFLLPQLQAAGVAFGLTNRYPDFLGTSSVRAMVRNVLDFMRNRGYDAGLMGPGITGDPFQEYLVNRVLERANALVRYFAPEIEDVELPNLNAPKQNVVANLIVENAEAEWGVTYMDMTPGQKRVVDEAIWSVRNGASDNDRANEALAQMSDANMIAGGINMVMPGGMRARSEFATDNSRAIDEAIDTGVSTPASDNAFAVSRAINSGSPEASELNIANDELKAVGTEREQQLYQGYSEIAFSKNLDPMGYVEIAGKVYRGYEMNAMIPENRAKLAEAWLLDNGSSMAWLTSFRDKRDTVVQGSEQLTGYDTYKDAARAYEGGETYTYERTLDPVYKSGGIRAMREDLERLSPNFGVQIQAERKKLQDRGKTGEDLEMALDIWANGPEGYNAYRGVRDELKDPELQALSDPTRVPVPITQPEATTTTGSTGTTTSGTTTDKPKKMPKWQVDLVNELPVYEARVAAFEAEHGPISSYGVQSDMVKEMIGEPSNDLIRYYEWRDAQDAAGQPSSIEAYIAFRDKEYEAKKVTDKAAADQAAATLGDVPTENKTAKQLLDEIEASK